MVFQELLCRRVRAVAMSALQRNLLLLTRTPNRQSYEMTGTSIGNENFWFSIIRCGNNVNKNMAMEYRVHSRAKIGGVCSTQKFFRLPCSLDEPPLPDSRPGQRLISQLLVACTFETMSCILK